MPPPPTQAPDPDRSERWPSFRRGWTNACGAPEVERNDHGNDESCVWTSTCRRRVVVGMDRDTSELIAQLGTRVGMIMEDTSVTALTLGTVDGRTQKAKLGEIAAAVAKIEMLTKAMQALVT